MIPHTYPTFNNAVGKAYMKVFFLSSVAGLTRWVDYIPVKTVSFSATGEGTTNADGHMTVTQVASSTALTKWIDYIPVYEDAAATVAFNTGASGYIPVTQILDIDFRLGILDSRITFARADATTCATYFDSTGRLQTVAANVARFDYDPATLLPRGLLIEESRTNIVPFSNSSLINANGTQAAGPNYNGIASTRFTADGTATRPHQIYTQNTAVAITGATSYVTTVYVKSISGTGFVIVGPSTTGTATGDTNTYAVFNLNTGVVGTKGSSTTASSIQSIGNGVYRCSCTWTSIATPAAGTVAKVWACDDANGTATALSDSNVFDVFGFQCELGAFPTSYIATTGSAVTRAADVATMTGTNFSSWYNQTQGTFVVESTYDSATGAVQNAIQVDDATASNRMFLRRSAASAGDVNIVAATVFQNPSAPASNNITQGVVTKQALAYSAATSSIALNGGVGTASGALTIPTVTQASIGSALGASYTNGHIRRISYYSTRLPNVTLQNLTA